MTEEGQQEGVDSEQLQKKSRMSEWILTLAMGAAAVVTVGIMAWVLLFGTAEYEPTTSDKVADILTGAYYDGAPNTHTVPLSESSNGTYGGESTTYLGGGDCKIAITYQAAGEGRREFATATTQTRKCRVAYSVDTLGYFEDWSFPDRRVTYMPNLGVPIRQIAFAACMPNHDDAPVPNCTTVLMGGEPR